MSNIPRRERMARPARLQAAAHWIPRYSGKSLVRGYCKYFGVDVPCALTELNMLRIKLDPDYVQQVKRSWENRIKEKQKRAELVRIRKQEEEALWALQDSDDFYAYIAGYTEGGAAFGITWEEMAAIEKAEAAAASGAEANDSWQFDDDDMPYDQLYIEVMERFLAEDDDRVKLIDVPF